MLYSTILIGVIPSTHTYKHFAVVLWVVLPRRHAALNLAPSRGRRRYKYIWFFVSGVVGSGIVGNSKPQEHLRVSRTREI